MKKKSTIVLKISLLIAFALFLCGCQTQSSGKLTLDTFENTEIQYKVNNDFMQYPLTQISKFNSPKLQEKADAYVKERIELAQSQHELLVALLPETKLKPVKDSLAEDKVLVIIKNLASKQNIYVYEEGFIKVIETDKVMLYQLEEGTKSPFYLSLMLAQNSQDLLNMAQVASLQ